MAMFGWFAPKCPLDTVQKTWTERRMSWLVEKFGIDRLLEADVVLPTEDYFPDPYRPTAKHARRIMDRLCEFMGVNSQNLQLEICKDVQLPGAAGHYDSSTGTVIRIADSQLAKAGRLIATLAHELSHVMLLGSGLLSTDVADH